MLEPRVQELPEIVIQTPKLLDADEVMAYMPQAYFFLWFTPIVSKLPIIIIGTFLFLVVLYHCGFLTSVILPLAVTYLNSLKPFLQTGISQSFAPIITGFDTLIRICFLVTGAGITYLTIRIQNSANAICLTGRGLSIGTSKPQKEQLIYLEKQELNFADVKAVEVVRPKTTRSNLDYMFIFRRGVKQPLNIRYGDIFLPKDRDAFVEAINDLFSFRPIVKQPLKIRYGDILKPKDRNMFVEAIKERFSDRIDEEMFEPFEISSEKQSYTSLWLKELSAPPKRNKLTPLELGAQLNNGRYSIISKIGMGGQGTVYLAQDNQAKEESEREIVLKEFLLPVFPDTRVRKAAAIKFQEEATLLGKLSHPQIVKFFELFLEDHRAYLVLEKLNGMTLKEYVDTQGAFPAQTVEELTAQMCTILQYLHNQTPPVVHRDFTPDNLILGDDGQIKLLDFSVAQSVTSNVTGSVVGKPHYIAPEQFRGKATWQSDIYSLGATLYFISTGKQPEPITNLKLQPGQASPKLAKIIEKATKLDTLNRYKKVEEILMDLV